jgi:uncharacterized protein YqjF (DUF2071 family)
MTHNPSRQYPPPSRPWIMRQVWNDLLFAHWPIPVRTMRAVVPSVLPLDSYDGWAWVGVVPFWMSGVRPRGVPPLPWLSTFPELNVRTYVTLDDKPGIYFFSLDAANPLAVWAARVFFYLPYFNARMACAWRGDWFQYQSTRTHRGARPAQLVTRYRPTGPLLPYVKGSLDDFLTSRYCLYAVRRDQRVYRLDIDHPLWPLQPAEAEFAVNTMTQAAGLDLPDTPPLLHFAKKMEMVGWWHERVR